MHKTEWERTIKRERKNIKTDQRHHSSWRLPRPPHQQHPAKEKTRTWKIKRSRCYTQRQVNALLIRITVFFTFSGHLTSFFPSLLTCYFIFPSAVKKRFLKRLVSWTVLLNNFTVPPNHHSSWPSIKHQMSGATRCSCNRTHHSCMGLLKVAAVQPKLPAAQIPQQ